MRYVMHLTWIATKISLIVILGAFQIWYTDFTARHLAHLPPDWTYGPTVRSTLNMVVSTAAFVFLGCLLWREAENLRSPRWLRSAAIFRRCVRAVPIVVWPLVLLHEAPAALRVLSPTESRAERFDISVEACMKIFASSPPEEARKDCEERRAKERTE